MLKKKGEKVRYNIVMLSVEGVEPGLQISLEYKRGFYLLLIIHSLRFLTFYSPFLGSKKENQGETATVIVGENGVGTFTNENALMTCTLFKDGSEYEPKNIVFTVKEVLSND